MTTITLETEIAARPEVCFDLSLSLDLHMISTRHTGEQAIGGKTTGMIGPGESVTWKAKHFGFWFTMTNKITEFVRPAGFTDMMISGPFKSLRHVHAFTPKNEITVMTDEFTFQSPFGAMGLLVDRLVLKRHLTKLLRQRNTMIKAYAESGRWKELIKQR